MTKAERQLIALEKGLRNVRKLPTWSTWNCLPQEAGLFEDTNIKTSILVINLDQGPAKK